jgi:tetratricopeptide (TPR) repeat protein
MADNANADSELARKLLREGQTQEAIAIYQKLIDENSRLKAGAAYCIGLIYEDAIGIATDQTKAQQYYELAEAGGYKMAKYGLGSIFYRRGDFKKALNKYREVADINPSAAYWCYRILKDSKYLSEKESEADEYLSLAIAQGHMHAICDEIYMRICGKRGIFMVPGGIFDLFILFFRLQKAYSKGEKIISN